MTDAAAVEAAIADAHRREWARVLAATARVARDLDLAEEKLERDGRLSGYQYLPAIKADLLSRTGEAADAYRQAFALAANEAERTFLAEQIAGQIAEHTVLA